MSWKVDMEWKEGKASVTLISSTHIKKQATGGSVCNLDTQHPLKNQASGGSICNLVTLALVVGTIQLVNPVNSKFSENDSLEK